MAKSKFINPLFQRTDAPEPDIASQQASSVSTEQEKEETAALTDQPRLELGQAHGEASHAPATLSGDVPQAASPNVSFDGATDARVDAPGRSSQQRRPGQRPSSSPARRRLEAAAPLEAPVKFTFYFSPAQLRRLDDLWVRTKLDHGERLNKSEFVRLALDHLLAEFEKNPRRVLNDLRRQRP